MHTPYRNYAAPWRVYRMAVYYNERSNAVSDVREVSAPDLDYAFAEARRTWPTAKRWTCLGAGDEQ